jgi:inosose dehydratase
VSSPSGPRLAVNPIPYWLAGTTPDKSTANLGRAMQELSDIGYTAVKADVPTDMDPGKYLDWLESFGLAPALSLYSGQFTDPATHQQIAEEARRFAADQASFGQTVTMISTMEKGGSPRLAHPAVGFNSDPDRLKIVVDGIRLSCEAMREEGVQAAIHPHVGGWVETEHELRAVLDDISPDLLAFGPDTGHMSWAGMDVRKVLQDYSNRIVGIHIKDTFQPGIDRARTLGLGYVAASRPGGIWAEPGTGDLDLTGCIEVFREGFAGDYMIEVDVPTVPLKQCHQMAYDWAVANLDLHW